MTFFTIKSRAIAQKTKFFLWTDWHGAGCTLRANTNWHGYPCQNGAGGEIRTHDLHLGKVALYQLSYARNVSNGVPSGIRTHVKGFADPRLAARPSVLTF